MPFLSRNQIFLRHLNVTFETSMTEVTEQFGDLVKGVIMIRNPLSKPEGRDLPFAFRGATHRLDGFADFLSFTQTTEDNYLGRVCYNFTAILTPTPPSHLHLVYYELTIQDRLKHEVFNLHRGTYP